jgi:hypothetical protein
VNGQAKGMNGRLSSRDRQKMEQYFTAIREVEKSLAQEKAWLSRPRPHVEAKEPKDGTVSQQLPILFDLVALALQTDSTRVATIEVPGSFDTAAMGIEEKGYHGYSHHGKDPALMAGMRKVEHYQMVHLARFLAKLEECGLLDTTQVLFGSGMSDGNSHNHDPLPVVLAGRAAGAWRLAGAGAAATGARRGALEPSDGGSPRPSRPPSNCNSLTMMSVVYFSTPAWSVYLPYFRRPSTYSGVPFFTYSPTISANRS